jgi:tripeptide aminopeptidase
VPLPNRICEDRLLAEFLEIVQIDSPVFHEGEFAGALECKLASLGFHVVNDHTGPSSGNLIGTLPGTIDGGKAVALSAHLDTVEPGRGIVPVVREGVVWSSGNTVLGADNKASLAAILETMRVIQGAELAHPDIELLITWGEEFGLAGAAKLDVSPVKSRLCFTLDGVSEIGTVITCAPIHYSFKATFQGRAAHAGAAPEKGINALEAAANSIARMRLGRIDSETTANVGLLQAGTARNAVPALAELEGETRSLDDSKGASCLDAICRVMKEEADNVGASLDLHTQLDYPSYRFAPDAPTIVAATIALERIGVPVRLIPSGGGSDANILNAKGLPSVVLGTGMVDPHTVSEHIAVKDLVLLTALTLELVKLAGEGFPGVYGV